MTLKLANRFLAKFKASCLCALNTILSFFENYLPCVVINSSAPVFILGAPRSGSTLLVQAVVDSFDVGYISNIHSICWGSPALVQYLFPFRLLAKRKKSSFDSFHGQTKGLLAPSECGHFWYRFFRRKPAYVPIQGISSKKLKAFRRSVNALIAAFGKPLIFKNLYASLRIQPIVRAFPNALFIVVKRDEIDNGHSILEARFKTYGSYDRWWSLEPPNIDDLRGLPPSAQVIEQIRSTYNTIQRDFEAMQVPASHVHYVQYEKFCEDPSSSIMEIAAFFGRNILSVSCKISLPQAFSRRTEIQIDPSLYAEMSEYSHSERAAHGFKDL